MRRIDPFDTSFRNILDSVLQKYMKSEIFSLTDATRCFMKLTDFPIIGRGYHKAVFQDHPWVIKIGSWKTIEQDRLLFENVVGADKQFFAQTFFGIFHEIQELGKPAKLRDFNLVKGVLKRVAMRNNMTDIHKSNVCMFDGVIKIIDANPSRRKHV